jgi:hypothetical protein
MMMWEILLTRYFTACCGAEARNCTLNAPGTGSCNTADHALDLI